MGNPLTAKLLVCSKYICMNLICQKWRWNPLGVNCSENANVSSKLVRLCRLGVICYRVSMPFKVELQVFDAIVASHLQICFENLRLCHNSSLSSRGDPTGGPFDEYTWAGEEPTWILSHGKQRLQHRKYVGEAYFKDDKWINSKTVRMAHIFQKPLGALQMLTALVMLHCPSKGHPQEIALAMVWKWPNRLR